MTEKEVEYFKKHKAELKKQGLVFDEKTKTVLVDESGYIGTKEKKSKK